MVKNAPLAVANEVIDRVRKGKKVNLSEIQRNVGYSPSSVRGHKAIKTKTFQNAIQPVISKMFQLREKGLQDLDKRNFSKERMDTVINLVKQMTHDTQLLSGKATDNLATNVVVYGSDDFLATQIKQNVK